MHLDPTEKQTPEHDTNGSKKANKWPKVSFLKGKVYHAGIPPYKENAFDFYIHTSPGETATLIITTHAWNGKELTKLGEATSNIKYKIGMFGVPAMSRCLYF